MQAEENQQRVEPSGYTNDDHGDWTLGHIAWALEERYWNLRESAEQLAAVDAYPSPTMLDLIQELDWMRGGLDVLG